MGKYVINIEGLGAVEVTPRLQSRSIRLSVAPPKGGGGCAVRVSCPLGVERQRVVAFVEEKKSWVVATIKRLEERYAARGLVYCADSVFRTVRGTIRFEVWEDGKHIGLRHEGYDTTILYPSGLAFEEESIQKLLRKCVGNAMMKEAMEYFPRRVAEIAKSCGLRHGAVMVKDMKSKWGYCTSRNDICLSVHLLRMGQDMIDHVILHELCHTRHRNHGEAFHELLNRLEGGREKALNARLKECRM